MKNLFWLKKKLFHAVAWVLFVFLSLSPLSYAADDPFVKLGRGITNVLTAPAEIFRQPVLMEYDYNMVTAFFGGISKGLVYMVGRELAGVYEVVTFPIDSPKGYKPVIDPPTIFDGNE